MPAPKRPGSQRKPVKTRKWTAQQKVKASQNANKRQRIHGGSHSGEFAKGAGSSGVPRKDLPGGQTHLFGTSAGHIRAEYSDNLARAKAGELDPQYVAGVLTEHRHGIELTQADRQQGEIKNRVLGTVADVSSARGSSEAGGAIDPSKDGERRKGASVRVHDFMDMNPHEKAFIESEMSGPDGLFSRGLKQDSAGNVLNTTKRKIPPGSHNRIQKYATARADGMSREDAIKHVQTDGRGAPGQKKATTTPRTTGVARSRTGLDTKNPNPTGRKSKYVQTSSRANELRVGPGQRAADSIDTLREKMPDSGDLDLVRTQQLQRQYLGDEMLKNQTWAHETRKGNMIGETQGAEAKIKGPDRVVFFTTNLGGPAPSVPTDSLIGQYIIKRRVNMLKSSGINPKALKGRFPEAARDMHIFEASTGLSLGAVGTYGVYQKSGWRRGSQTSKNFGKPVALGSHVQYGSDGRAIYDKAGNHLYTNGATRDFKLEQTKDVGFRIFLG